MGYNNNHAGIHPVPNGYNWKTDTLSPFDKYATIIAENSLNIKQEPIKDSQKEQSGKYAQESISEKVVLPSDEEIIGLAQDNNIELWDTAKEEEFCSCGNSKRLQFRPRLDVNLQMHGASLSIKVPGRFCSKCNKRFVVKKDFVKTIRNACGWK